MPKKRLFKCLNRLLIPVPFSSSGTLVVRNFTASIRFSLLQNRSSLWNALNFEKQFHLDFTHYKYKKSRNDTATDDDNEHHSEFKDERDSKVLKTNVNSLRADLLIKAGLGMARNKIETIFYDSKVRVNGHKLSKKSVLLNIGDEIDVIKGFSPANLSHLLISRVVILAANEREEGFNVNLRCYKSLLVENYSGANAYKFSEISDHLK